MGGPSRGGMLGDVEVKKTASVVGQYEEDIQKAAVGTDHAAVGRDLASLWALPKELSDAICFHHSPPPSTSPALPVIVALANAVAGQADHSYPEVLRVPVPENPLVPIEPLILLAQETLE